MKATNDLLQREMDGDFGNGFFRGAKSNTKKLEDYPIEKTCKHPEHNPPTMRLFEPGFYKHTCPNCGHEQNFVVEPKPEL